MTATDTEDLAASLAADPAFMAAMARQIRARPQQFFNMAGEAIGALAATGRVQVSPGQTISSAGWGNPVWDQSVNCFASAADRDAQWPAPHDGSVCFQADTGTLWQRRAGVWHGMPAGVLGFTTSTSNSASTTTNTDWFTAPAITGDGFRRIRVSFNGTVSGGVVGDLLSLRLMEGATILASIPSRVNGATGSGQMGLSGFWHGVPAVGAHTYKVNLLQQAGTGPSTGLANAGLPAQILIEDIGT